MRQSSFSKKKSHYFVPFPLKNPVEIYPYIHTRKALPECLPMLDKRERYTPCIHLCHNLLALLQHILDNLLNHPVVFVACAVERLHLLCLCL